MYLHLLNILSGLAQQAVTDTLPDCVAVRNAFETTALQLKDSTVDQRLISRLELRARLAGRYRLVAIGSEGFGPGRWLQEWDLQLRPDSVPKAAVRIGGPPSSVILSGTATLVWNGWLQSPKRVSGTTTESFRVLAPMSGPLQLESAPFDLFDGNGRLFPVERIDEAGTWMGRWMSGGFEAFVVRTPSAEVLEQQAGYFCMFLRRPRT